MHFLLLIAILIAAFVIIPNEDIGCGCSHDEDHENG